MTGIAEKVGRAASVARPTAKFPRGRAMLAALALSLIAALALSEEASAHGTGNIGAHSHGVLTCGNYGRLHLEGYNYQGPQKLFAAAHGTQSSELDQVYYRAHLYRWNGRTWQYLFGTNWYSWHVNWYGGNLGFPTRSANPFAVAPSRGTYAASTEIHWYDGYLDGGAYLGYSPIAWARGTCTY